MKVLIQCGDHFENQMRIKNLALILKSNNIEPYILMYNRKKGGLFRELKINVIYLDDYLQLYNFQSVASKITDWLDIDIQYNEILNIEGQRIPRILWPGQIKNTFNNVHKNYYALLNIILSIKPDRIIIWNGQTGYVANCLRVIGTKKYIVPLAYLERGLIKDSLFIDNQGVNGASSLSRKVINLSTIEVNSEDIEMLAKYFPINENMIDKNIEFNSSSIRRIFFPLQVQRDTNILFYSPYRSMREVYFKINTFLSDDVEKIIRPHPEEDPEEFINIPVNSNTVITMSENLDYWIKNTDVTITINSTVGLEALIHGKPVITLGDSIYSNARITLNLNCLGLKGDKKIKYNNVLAYLKYLTSNNLIYENNENNEKIIAQQLNLQVTKKCYQQKKERWYASHINLHLLFEYGDKLDLTYRKNKEDISLNWIRKILETRFEYQELKIFEGVKEKLFLKDKVLTIFMISDIDIPRPQISCDILMDIYGNILELNYENLE